MLLEFSDFECPYCAKFTVDVLPTLQKQYIQSGRLQFAFRNLPIKSHAHAQAAALAVSCAVEQGKFEQLHDLFFANQKTLDDLSISRFVGAAGIDGPAHNSCLEKRAEEQVKADTDLAKSLGVTATPSFFIGTRGSDGRLVVRKTITGMKAVGEFVDAVNDALSSR